MEVAVKISSQYNNCSFHTLTLELIKNLSSNRLKQTKGYEYFRQAFAEYYYLEENEALDARITSICSTFSHPLDQQVLLGPVLRLTLKSILADDREYKALARESFKGLIHRCKREYNKNFPRSRQIRDLEHLIKVLGELAFEGDEQEPLFKANIKIIAEHILQKRRVLSAAQWNKAYQSYLDYMGDLGAGAYVSFDELSLLCHSFDFECINVEYDAGLEIDNPIATVRVKNVTGDHWELADEEILEVSPSIFNQYHDLSCSLQSRGAHSHHLKTIQDAFRKKINEWIVGEQARVEEVHVALVEPTLPAPRKAIRSKDRKEWVDAINKMDLITLLQLYHAEPDYRVAIERDCKKRGKNGKTLCNKIKFYYAKYLHARSANEDTDQEHDAWEAFLEDLPIVEDISGDTRLHWLIRKNDLRKIENVITDETDFTVSNEQGFTPLHLACALDREKIVESMLYFENKNNGFFYRILYSKIDIRLKDKNGQNILHHCASMKSEKTLMQLFKLSSTTIINEALTAHDYNGRTPIHIAAKNPNKKILEHMVAFSSKKSIGAACTSPDEIDMTPLHYATASGLIENVKILLPINMGASKISPLSLAITGTLKAADRDSLLEDTYFEIIDILLKEKSDLQICAVNADLNAAGAAALCDRDDLLKEWQNRFGSIIVRDEIGRTPIYYAIEGGSVDSFKYLLKIKDKLTQRDDEQNTPLHIAVRHNQIEIIKYICSVYKKEQKKYHALMKTDNPLFKMLGRLQQGVWDFQGCLDIDATNAAGETPYMVAIHHGRMEAAEILKCNGASPDLLLQYIYKAIYYPDPKKAQALGYPDFEVLEEKIAGSSHRYTEIIAQHTDEKGNTLIHHCVLAKQYRLIKILLHPLTQEKRESLCQKQNHKNETAYDWLCKMKRNAAFNPLGKRTKKRSKRVDKNTKLLLEKIERLLIPFYPEKFNEMSIVSRAQYHYQWQQDVKEEIMRSYWYGTASTLSRAAMPLYKAGAAYVATGQPWFAMTGFVEGVIGEDFFTKAEVMLNYLRNYLPESMQTPANYAQNIFWVLGMHTNTTTRLSIEVLRYAVALGIDYAPSQFDNKNYLTCMNRMGLLLAVTEELTRHYFSPQISKVTGFYSIQESLVPYGVPRVGDVVKEGVNQVNKTIEEVLGVNVKSNVYGAYLWARENIGRVPPPNQVFNEKYLGQLQENWHCEDKSLEQQYTTIAKTLFEDSYDYGYAELTNNQFLILSEYVKNRIFSDSVCQVFSQASVLMSESGLNSADILYDVLSQSALINSMNISEEDRNSANRALQDALNSLVYVKKENVFDFLKEVVSKSHNESILKHIENEKIKLDDYAFLIEDVNVTLTELIDALVESNKDDGYELLFQTNTLLRFVMSGEIHGEEKYFLDLFEGSNMGISELLSKLYVSSQGYALFNFDGNLAEGHVQVLQEAIDNGLKEKKSIEEIFKLTNEILVGEFVENRVNTLLEEGSYDDQFKELFQTLNLPLLLETWNDYNARKDVMSGMYSILFSIGTVEQQSDYLVKISQQAETMKYDVSEVVKIFFQNSEFVKQFSSDQDFIEQQASALLNSLSSLKNPECKIKPNEILMAPLSAILEKYINNTFINDLDNPTIKDGVEKAVLQCANGVLNDFSELNDYLKNAWQVINNGQVTNENAYILEEIGRYMSSQGHNGDEVIVQILTQSPGYKSVNFRSTVVQKHEAELLEAIQLCREQQLPFSSIFEGEFYKGDTLYLYPLSKKGIEAFKVAHQGDVLDVSSDKATTNSAQWIVNCAVDGNRDKNNEQNLVAMDIANLVIKHFYPGYPEIVTPEVEEEKLKLYAKITNEKMEYYHSDHETAKKNLKRFVASLLSGEEEPELKHPHKWWGYLTIGAVNFAFGLTTGWQPFHRFPISEELIGSSSSNAKAHINYDWGSNGGSFKPMFSFNDVPIWSYNANSKKEKMDFSLAKPSENYFSNNSNFGTMVHNLYVPTELQNFHEIPNSFFENMFNENMEVFLDNMHPTLSQLNKPDYYASAFYEAYQKPFNAEPQVLSKVAPSANDQLFSLARNTTQASSSEKDFLNLAFLYPPELTDVGHSASLRTASNQSIFQRGKEVSSKIVGKAGDFAMDALFGPKAEAAVPLAAALAPGATVSLLEGAGLCAAGTGIAALGNTQSRSKAHLLSIPPGGAMIDLLVDLATARIESLLDEQFASNPHIAESISFPLRDAAERLDYDTAPERPSYDTAPERPDYSTESAVNHRPVTRSMDSSTAVCPSYMDEVFSANAQEASLRETGRLVFPIHQDENAGFLPGQSIDDLVTAPTILTNPAIPRVSTRFETLMDQPGPHLGPCIFPIEPNPPILMYSQKLRSASRTNEVELYRAVTIPEYEQIKETGIFQGIGNNAKYFSKTLEGARLYALKENTQNYVIVSTKINSRIANNNQVIVDGGIPTVVLPDKDLPKLSQPVFVDQNFLLNDYFKQANGQVMKLPEHYTGLSYSHVSTNTSNGILTRRASINIIPDQQTGQSLLDSAYVNPAKPNQLFNYYEGQVIRFTLTNNRVWQTEIVNEYVNKAVGTEVLKSFRNDGLISNAEYKTLLKM